MCMCTIEILPYLAVSSPHVADVVVVTSYTYTCLSCVEQWKKNNKYIHTYIKQSTSHNNKKKEQKQKQRKLRTLVQSLAFGFVDSFYAELNSFGKRNHAQHSLTATATTLRPRSPTLNNWAFLVWESWEERESASATPWSSFIVFVV